MSNLQKTKSDVSSRLQMIEQTIVPAKYNKVFRNDHKLQIAEMFSAVVPYPLFAVPFPSRWANEKLKIRNQHSTCRRENWLIQCGNAQNACKRDNIRYEHEGWNMQPYKNNLAGERMNNCNCRVNNPDNTDQTCNIAFYNILVRHCILDCNSGNTRG